MSCTVEFLLEAKGNNMDIYQAFNNNFRFDRSHSAKICSQMPLVWILIALILATVDSKGKSHNSGGSNRTPIVTHSGTNTVCYNEYNQVIPCPSNNVKRVVAIVIGSILGAFLLGLVAFFVIKRIRLRRAAQNFESARKVSLPLRSHKEYQALGSDESPSDVNK